MTTHYSQEVIRGEYVSGDFWIEPEGRVVAVNVRDPLGATVYFRPHAHEGNFAYTAADNGEYKACFSNTVDRGTSLFLTLCLTVCCVMCASDLPLIGLLSYTAPPTFITFAEGPKTIKFRLLSGAEAKPQNVATKKNIRPLETQVRHLEEIVAGIRRDESWLSRRQEEMRALNESTATQVLWFNIVSIVVLVSMGIIQIWYLKNYFREKKLMVD